MLDPILHTVSIEDQLPHYLTDDEVVEANLVDYIDHLPLLHPHITGLDGRTRYWDDVFLFFNPVHRHTNDTASWYVVRQTFFDRDTPHVDRASFPATGEGYTDALDAARWLREHTEGGYAVIDRAYACGCRTNG